MNNFVNFGAVGDGVTDNAAAWGRAFATLNPQGDRLYIPAGKYLSSVSQSFTYPNGRPCSLAITGDGADVTTLYWPRSSGLTLNASNARHSIHLRDLTLSTGTQGFSGLNLLNSVSEGNFAQNDLINVTFRGDDGGQASFGWATDVNIQNWSNINFQNALVYGAGNGYGNGVVINSTNPSVPGIVYNFSLCGFFNLGVGISYGSVQGMTVSQCNFTNGVTGIWCPPGQRSSSQLAVSDSQFNTTSCQILGQSLIGQVLLANNMFLITPPGFGVVLWTSSGEIVVSGNGSFPSASATVTGNVFLTL